MDFVSAVIFGAVDGFGDGFGDSVTDGVIFGRLTRPLVVNVGRPCAVYSVEVRLQLSSCQRRSR